ncbi:hypothetical protein PG997_002286 [Apiospora hydei]|uniref:Mid2 domain-containing protein n=1 Tax=Apiospora hydei TaxID=1337664 RepID=A0ABR1X971_9PEZI
MYNWTVSTGGFDLSFISVYYLQVSNGLDTATTHYFNITSKEPTETATSTSAPSSSPSSKTPSSLSNPPKPNSSSAAPTATVRYTATAEPNVGDKPLPTGTLVGILFGSVAALISLMVGVWWAFRVWKRERPKGGETATADPHSSVGSIGAGGDNSNNNNKKKKTFGTEVGGNPLNEAEARPYVPPVHEVDSRQIYPRQVEMPSHE